MKPILAAMLALLFPALALAQEAAPAAVPDAPISDVSTAMLALLAALIPALVAGLRWGGGLVAKQVEKHVENEWVRGALGRLLAEVYSLADLVGTEAEHLILAARDAASPGGAAITHSELDAIGQAILAKLSARYGGWSQLFDTLRRVGLGETEDQARTALLSHIETAVATKLAADPPTAAAA